VNGAYSSRHPGAGWEKVRLEVQKLAWVIQNCPVTLVFWILAYARMTDSVPFTVSTRHSDRGCFVAAKALYLFFIRVDGTLSEQWMQQHVSNHVL